MTFTVEENVKELGLKVIGFVIEGLENKNKTEEYLEYRKNALEELRIKYKDFETKEDAVLEGFHKLHDHANIPRRKNIPASENLIKLFKKHGEMPEINKVVDLYNIVSMKSKLAVGAHDRKNIEGNVTLRFTTGTEKYIPLGIEEAKEVKRGEYAYIDDANEIICRLEVRQVNKTKVTEETKDVFYIVEGNEFTSLEEVKMAADEIIAITTKFCGGKGKFL